MRWMVRIVVVLFTLVLLALSAIFLIPAERLAGIAAQQFQTATGRPMAISGTVRPSLFPVIGARVEGVRIENAPWSDAGPMLEADIMDLGLDLVALARGDFIIRRFELHAPRVLLERHADGRANWLFEGLANGGSEPDSQPPASETGQPARTLAVDMVEIHDASLRFVDHGAGTDMHMQGLDGELRLPDFDGPASLSLTGRLNGQAFSAEAGIGAFSGLLAGEVTAISAQLRAGDSAVGFEGRAGLQPLAAEGRASIDAQALAPLLALAGQSGPEPLPAALRPLGFDGRITLAPAGSVHLREGGLTFGRNQAVLALDLSFDGPRPRLTGSINAESLDLRGLAGEADGAGGGEGWPSTPIDASAVGLADAAVTIRSGPVQSDALDLQSLHTVLDIDRARAVFDLREIRLFDGLARGEFVINNRSGLSVGGNLRASDIALLPMLTQLADFERISGTGEVELRFLGVGESLDAIMRRLSGEGRIALGEGEIIGLDLAGMLRNLDMAYMGEGNRTIFDSVTGSFTIENGVLDSRDLRLEARRVAVAGRGLVDIGERRLDYRLAPSAMRDPESGAALTVPLQVTGPWSQPRFRLDLEGLAEERLREERERLEARARQEIERIEQQARERVESGLRERLEGGAEGENGQSLRDGARERLEGEIGRGLQRILGRDGTD